MKGIPTQTIINTAKRMNLTLEELYMKLYNGDEITFDLLLDNNCFRKTKCYEQVNMSQFVRKMKF